jgi:hypothetical protein
MGIADFGSCYWQPQRVGSTLGEETGGRQPVRSGWISRRKTNQDEESVTSLAMPLRQLMPNVTVVFDAAIAWQ